jgi:hypothetical protein
MTIRNLNSGNRSSISLSIGFTVAILQRTVCRTQVQYHMVDGPYLTGERHCDPGRHLLQTSPQSGLHLLNFTFASGRLLHLLH